VEKLSVGDGFFIGDIMDKIKDLTGKKFNNLLVIEKTEERKQNKVVWLCLCDCGNYTKVVGSALSADRIKSCGCLRHKKKERDDIIDKRFGSWMVKNFVERDKYGESLYLCKCDCGAEKKIRRSILIYGRSKSCGCSMKKELSGKIFGKYKVIKRSDRKDHWICECQCGKVKEVRGSHLLTDNTISCGCLISKENNKISKILYDLNIEFEKEKGYINCCNKNMLRFDFYLPEYNLCIEFQGEQHYRSVNIFNGDIGYIGRKRNDYIKKQFCKNNNINFLEIPYWYKNHAKELILEEIYKIKNNIKE
jgi:hypothetical protein